MPTPKLTFHSLAIGHLYPSYACYRALKRNASNAELVERLATWGVCATVLQVTSRALDPMLGFWLPLYHPAKVGLMLWLVAPRTKGGATVFVKYVEPAMERVEESVDELTGQEGPER